MTKDPERKRVVLKSGPYHIIMWSVASALGVLILLQSARELISSIYYYNLVNLSITPHVALLLLVLIPLGIGRFVRRSGWKTGFLLSGAVTVFARLPMGMGLEDPLHLVFSAITFAGSSVFLTLVLSLHRREREVDPDVFSSQSIVASFGIAYLLLTSLYALGRGLDPSIVPKAMGPMLSPMLSGIICGLMAVSLYGMKDGIVLARSRGGKGAPGSKITGGMADAWSPAWGIGASIFVFMVVISNPSVVAGWLGGRMEFQWVLSMTIVAQGLFLISLLSSSGFLLSLRRSFGHPKGAVIGNVFLVLAALNLFFFKYPVPTAPLVMIWIGMVDTWVILDAATDHRPFAGESFEIDGRSGRRVIGFPHKKRTRTFPDHFGRAVSLGLSLPFILILLVTVSMNWSFVPLGFLLKGSIPLLMFIGVLALALTGFSCSKARIEEPSVKISQRTLHIDKGSPTVDAGKGSGTVRELSELSPRLRTQWITIGAVTITFIILTGVMSVVNYSGGAENRSLVVGETISVVTFNIHHGFSNEGRVDPVPQYELLRDLDPDIVFLQESDSLRFAEGNIDPAFYLSSRLNMHLFRGPDPGEGTHGVAILSRFPMEDRKVHLLESNETQRVAISCKVKMAEVPVRLVSLHLGLEESERRMQLSELKDILEDFEEEMIVGGDFNTEPDESFMAYMNPKLFGRDFPEGDPAFVNATGLRLLSAWHSADQYSRSGPLTAPTFPAPGLDEESQHIDYILFSTGFSVQESRIDDDREASDHRLVWTRLRLQ
ncbi:MAG: endonuclease/exonuclease/phosphatase family protein [Thermoplasmatota archaeon]